jgi:hypothetical protein
MSVTHPFTKRILGHTDRVAVPLNKPVDPLVLSVKDELLVAQEVAPEVNNFLIKNKFSKDVPVDALPRVFGEAGASDDIVIIDLVKENAFAATDAVRRQSFLKDPQSVSPNHILIPAPTEDQCPWGPPSPAYGYPAGGADAGPSEPVTVIDASYLWKPAWGANPLEELCHLNGIRWAEWHKHGQKDWQPGTPTLPSMNGNLKVLDALAGHANFVAGVVAQGAPHPRITIWSHNGGFKKGSPEVPTEAAVCRSLWASQRPADAGNPPNATSGPEALLGAPAKVIHIGFAFHPYKGVPSVAWQRTFQRIKDLRSAADLPLIVAPAGNQNSPYRRYPAAFLDTLPLTVIGVASLQPGGNARSNFTNYGDWVTCSAVGEDVESTFLNVKMMLEEDMSTPRHIHEFRPNAWGTWNGTSFAAPKVTGAIAARLSAGAPSAIVAWNALQAVCQPNYNLTGAGTGSPGVGSCRFDF